MQVSVALFAALTASVFDGVLVSAGGVAHQHPEVAVGKDAMDEYVKVLEGNTTSDIIARSEDPSTANQAVSLRNDAASLFRRQTPGTGALLCPTGTCADGR
jgi:hypothetical protein